MDKKTFKDMIKLAKDNGLSELAYENEKEKYSVKFPYGSAQSVISQVAPSASAPAQALSHGEEDAKKNSGLIEVTSPFVGTFYKSSSPDTPAYVKVGDKVGSGSVLCIVEAMKIMNEIESEISGEIAEICVDNETYVEFGQVLFRIKP